MDAYESYQAKPNIGAVIGGCSAYFAKHEPARSRTHDWDRVVRLLCRRCGGTLRPFEVRNRLALCFSCRRALFPETIIRPSGRE
jgi:hypothetical protein